MLEPDFLITTIFHPQELLQQTLNWIQHLGLIGSLAFILLYICATIFLVPGSILTLGAGAVFGVFWGTIYVLLGALIGETCAFLLGRYVVKGWISHKMAHNQTFNSLNQAIAKKGLKIILLTRLSPIFPFSLLNYVFGVTGISLRDYFCGSIGMIPMTITYVYLGSLAELASIEQAAQLAHPQLHWAIKIFGLMATIMATTYITRTARVALDKSLNESVI